MSIEISKFDIQKYIISTIASLFGAKVYRKIERKFVFSLLILLF